MQAGEAYEADHINCDQTDNRACNVRWLPRSQNRSREKRRRVTPVPDTERKLKYKYQKPTAERLAAAMWRTVPGTNIQ
eukprot:20609-Heterococcus_DN1.PRE.6